MRKKELEKEVERQREWFADLIGGILDHLDLEIEFIRTASKLKTFCLVPKRQKKKEMINGIP